MTTINDILAELRTAATDERDKGDKFERLMVALPAYRPALCRPIRQRLALDRLARARRQTRHRNRPGGRGARWERTLRHPVQVLRPDPHLQKADIDSFFTASGKARLHLAA